MKIAVIYIRLGQSIWWSQEIFHLGKKKWKHDFYQLTKLSVDISSMYFSLKNDKRASTGMDKGFHFNLMSFNLIKDNHTIPSNLKIRSLDRFDDFMNFRSETDMIISRKKKLSMLRGTWGCHNLFWKRWKWQSLNFSIRQFKTSVTFN